MLESRAGNSKAASRVDVSVIVPAFNEAESLPQLHAELSATLAKVGRSYEIVLVNDGSSDNTAKVMDGLAQSDGHVTVIHFRRNYGQTAALSAGIDHSTGDVIVPIDADLQNDPADIPALVEKLGEGYDVASGWRRDRKDSAVTRTWPSRLANWLISTISGVELRDYGCTLKAYRREVMEGVRLYGEMHRFIPIYAQMQGGKVAEVVVNHRARKFGKSNYGLGRIPKVLLDLLLVKFLASYSAKPIYVFGGFGMLCLLASLLPIGLAILFKITPINAMQKDFVETPLPVIAAVLILVGMLALLQGIQAEVLMRTYFESQGKQTYVIRRIRRAGDRSEPRAPKPRTPPAEATDAPLPLAE